MVALRKFPHIFNLLVLSNERNTLPWVNQFPGLPPSYDKHNSHDLIRILKNGQDFQVILQNLGGNQYKSSVNQDF